jgi:UTP--glucose-1-phosphate uridylyltransferase
MKKQITKAIIPAAGFGTRFLPVTKAIPKEMLPIIDKPTIQVIIEEAVASGIEEVIIIINDYKPEIKKYFSKNKELETFLSGANKKDLIKEIRSVEHLVKIKYVVQQEQKGLGHAILQAKKLIAPGESFAVLLGDDVMINHKGKPVIKQLIDAYDKNKTTILGVQKVKPEDVSKYGIISYSKRQGRNYQVNGMVEKPDLKKAPSDVAILGRYILTYDIFKLLEKQVPGKGGEIQLTDAIAKLLNQREVFAYDFEGERFDLGNRAGFVKATLAFALNREDIRDEIKKYLKEIVKMEANHGSK